MAVPIPGRMLIRRLVDEAFQRAWAGVVRTGTIRSGSYRARRFGHFGRDSEVVFPVLALYNEKWISIGDQTLLSPMCSLSAGMAPGQEMLAFPVVSIGSRCTIGRGTSIVGHFSVEIGDDVWTGPNCYITDQNHGYEDLSTPIGLQHAQERPVVIGDGTWLGTAVVILPGSRVGRHVVIAAGSVVSGEIPDYSVAAGQPARVVRRYVEGRGWVRTEPVETGG